MIRPPPISTLFPYPPLFRSLGYSALKTGVTFVATAGTAVVSAGVAQALTTKLGAKPIIAVGLVLLIGGMIWYSQIPVDRKSTRLNSSHLVISYAVFCLNKKN